MFGFYTLTFQNLDFTSWSLRLFGFYILKFQVVVLCSTMKGPHVGFYTYVSKVFGFYSLKFLGVWILHPKVSEFRGVKSKHPKTLESKIQTFLKHRGKI